MTRIGFIGLGRMGRPMASNLCRKGFHLTVYDINEAAIHELEKLQARGASSVADVAAECDMVITMLPNSAAVEDVIASSDGVVANGRRGSLIMDMSTVDPCVTERSATEQGFARILSMLPWEDLPVMPIEARSTLHGWAANDADPQRVMPLLEDGDYNSITVAGGAGIRSKAGKQ